MGCIDLSMCSLPTDTETHQGGVLPKKDQNTERRESDKENESVMEWREDEKRRRIHRWGRVLRGDGKIKIQ